MNNIKSAQKHFKSALQPVSVTPISFARNIQKVIFQIRTD